MQARSSFALSNHFENRGFAISASFGCNVTSVVITVISDSHFAELVVDASNSSKSKWAICVRSEPGSESIAPMILVSSLHVVWRMTNFASASFSRIRWRTRGRTRSIWIDSCATRSPMMYSVVRLTLKCAMPRIASTTRFNTVTSSRDTHWQVCGSNPIGVPPRMTWCVSSSSCMTSVVSPRAKRSAKFSGTKYLFIRFVEF
mmetsp:Transcript_8725/g.21177  ORF Transcript_8725/g.21177 Transcript_8725/m.21177 type:complete len:202 (+) Transcript_8725:2979-3584(+)